MDATTGKAITMMSNEKTQLLSLFSEEGRWCQGAEAVDRDGNPVRLSDETAVAWDIVGGVCHLFGWQRARKLFVQLQRHICGRQKTHYNRDEEMAAMAALLDFNDASETSYEKVVATFEELPVWQGRPSLVGLDTRLDT